jgi:hypothetical protein
MYQHHGIECRLREDDIKANYRNAVYTKYTSDNFQQSDPIINQPLSLTFRAGTSNLRLVKHFHPARPPTWQFTCINFKYNISQC